MSNSAPQSLLIAEQLGWATQLLSTALGTDENPVLDSKLLLSHCLSCNLTYLHTWPDKTINVSQQADFVQLVRRRAAGEPVAYLLGYRDFWTLRLAVSEATLIPRPETELLVETALALTLNPDARILDLGTGTGAIALALASERPDWQVCGVDKQPEAVALAERNAQANQLSRVRFLQSDWFSQLAAQQFELIVSNPPYVEAQSPYLQQGDVRFEPLSALVSGHDGLDDIRYLIAESRRYLCNNGWLILEHGFNQAEAIQQLFDLHGYSLVQTVNDLNGLGRITLAKFCVE